MLMSDVCCIHRA